MQECCKICEKQIQSLIEYKVMISYRYRKLVILPILFFSFFLWGQEYGQNDVSNEFPTIEVRQVPPPDHINGILPSSEEVSNLSVKFFGIIKTLPSNFIKQSGIRYVTFLFEPKLKGILVGGLASKNNQTIYLSTKFTAKTVYHELFHVFDPVRQNKYWCRLNANNFVYTGSKYYSENLSKSKYKRARKNLSRMTYHSDFVSRYAMSNEREDRAETFAYMMVEGRYFLRRTQRSHVLKRKMDYIIQITTENNLVSNSFWKQHFRK